MLRLCHGNPALSGTEAWAAKNTASLKRLMRDDYAVLRVVMQFGSTKAERKEFEREFNEDWDESISSEEMGTIN